jgi:hypothetical protein
MNLTAVTGTFAHVPTDWIILSAVALLITLDALRSGASRAIALSLALPIAYTISILLPKTAFLDSVLKPFGTGIAGAIVILIIIAVLSVCTFRIARDYNSASALQATMAGVATTVLFVVFWIQMPLLGALWQFSFQATHVFGSTYAFLWMAGGYALLSVVRS